MGAGFGHGIRERVAAAADWLALVGLYGLGPIQSHHSCLRRHGNER